MAADSVIGTILNRGVSDRAWFRNGLPTQLFVVNATRVLLLLTFVGIALAVHKAWRRKETHE